MKAIRIALICVLIAASCATILTSDTLMMPSPMGGQAMTPAQPKF